MDIEYVCKYLCTVYSTSSTVQHCTVYSVLYIKYDTKQNKNVLCTLHAVHYKNVLCTLHAVHYKNVLCTVQYMRHITRMYSKLKYTLYKQYSTILYIVENYRSSLTEKLAPHEQPVSA